MTIRKSADFLPRTIHSQTLPPINKMKLKYILLIIFSLIHLIFTYRIQKKISSNILLNRKQKLLNSVMIWIFPFVWYNIVKDLIMSDYSIMTKSKRDKLIIKKGGGFYESGKGITG